MKRADERSICPKLLFSLAQHIGQPLQSRADQNTRKPESGCQPEKKQLTQWAENRVKVGFWAGSALTYQNIWHQARPGCPMAVRQRSGSGSYPKPVPRGEIQ
ncbi:MAG: hypothetical protein ABIQ90_13735 [Polaromonas sp.]